MKKLRIIISLVILFCFTFSCQQVQEEAEEPTIIVDTAISADGISIAYEVRGEGELALVFIHGWCCDRSYWNEQLPHFSQKYKVVAIDLAGHGESGLNRKEYTMAFPQFRGHTEKFDIISSLEVYYGRNERS